MPPKAGRKNSLASIIIVVLLLVALFVVKTCQRNRSTDTEERKTTRTTTNSSAKKQSQQENSRGLDRNPSTINYSKHARCRMDCRHISQAEVKEILQDGKINYKKSELDGAECKKRYAVEGTTSDNQKVRIIFAPCQTEVTVVTVIDIGKEWLCSCD